MNREIKFRAWNDVIKEMIYCDDKHYWAFFNSPDSIGYGLYHRNDGHRLLSGEYNPPIMQFTGMYSKDGTEIYEGDIVGGVNKSLLHPVVCKNGCFEWDNEPLGWDMENPDVESGKLESYSTKNWAVVYGNIYEHPELLKTTSCATQ